MTQAKIETSEKPLRHGPEQAAAPALLGGRSPGAFVLGSAIGPRIMLAPADAAPAAPAAPAATPDPAAPADPSAPPPAAAPAAKLERPDYIPESFWDADKGFKADDLNALVAFKAERDAEAAQVPAASDKYEAKLPHDFKLPDGVKLPDGTSALNPDDPRIALARDFAFSAGMNQSAFEGLLALGVQMDLAEETRLNEALGQQRQALGAKANERISAVTSWLSAKVGGELAQALAPMMYTAKQVEAFEAIMRVARGTVPGNPGGGRAEQKADMSDEEWSKLSPTERINWARQNSKK